SGRQLRIYREARHAAANAVTADHVGSVLAGWPRYDERRRVNPRALGVAGQLDVHLHHPASHGRNDFFDELGSANAEGQLRDGPVEVGGSAASGSLLPGSGFDHRLGQRIVTLAAVLGT